MSPLGRFLPLAAFWAGSPLCTPMLQCDRQESATIGRSVYSPLKRHRKTCPYHSKG